MVPCFNPLNHPILFSSPGRLTPYSAWHEHIPFAMLLIDLLRPNLIVELGTHYGDSYCAFCQAVQELNLHTRCYAIDTWEGDPHAGRYGPEVLADLRAYHDPLYGSFSSLIKSTFEDALRHFSPATIDLLHIDGYHSYDAVRHDFESWLPKLSSRGVVLLHDINVREDGFVVWMLWDEVKRRYPHFEFLHGHGLGVVAVGTDQPESVQALLGLSLEDVLRVRQFFFHFAQRLTLKAEQQVLLAAGREGFGREAAQLQATIQEQQNALAQENEEISRLGMERDESIREAARLQAKLEALWQQTASIEDTIGWRILDRYRKVRAHSRILERLHFLLTKPIKRLLQKK